MTKKSTARLMRDNVPTGNNAFAGKRVGQSKKINAIRKRDARLRKITKGRYSIVNFAS